MATAKKAAQPGKAAQPKKAAIKKAAPATAQSIAKSSILAAKGVDILAVIQINGKHLRESMNDKTLDSRKYAAALKAEILKVYDNDKTVWAHSREELSNLIQETFDIILAK